MLRSLLVASGSSLVFILVLAGVEPSCVDADKPETTASTSIQEDTPRIPQLAGAITFTDKFEIVPGGRGDFSLHVGSCDQLEVTVATKGATFLSRVIDPSGELTELTVANAKIEFEEVDGVPGQRVTWTTDDPIPGEWKLRIIADSEKTGIGLILACEYGGADVDLDVSTADGPRRVLIETGVEWRGKPVLDAKASARITNPSQREQTLTLLDDGLLEDRIKGDGVYTAALNDSMLGPYPVYVHVDATSADEYVINRDASILHWISARPADLAILAEGVRIEASPEDSVYTVHVAFCNKGPGPANYATVRIQDAVIGDATSTEYRTVDRGTRVDLSRVFVRQEHQVDSIAVVVGLYVDGGRDRDRSNNVGRGVLRFDPRRLSLKD